MWQEKRARVGYRTAEEGKRLLNGGLGLSNLQDYYLAAQLRPLTCLCSPSYKAGWKDREGASVEGIPLISVLMDKQSQDELMVPRDSMLHTMLHSWKKISEFVN